MGTWARFGRKALELWRHFQEQRGRECPRNRHEESLLLSGHSERHEIDEIQSSNAPFLSKPFTPVELSVAIEKALQDRD